jgi:hypothetical protein
MHPNRLRNVVRFLALCANVFKFPETGHDLLFPHHFNPMFPDILLFNTA